MARVAMKKPLLFFLLVWVFLFALPWTRPMAVLDWKRATLERFSDLNPALTPRDAPYQPEKERDRVFLPNGMPVPESEAPGEVRAGEMQVAPQFASLARSSSDRDVLAWCARSAGDAQTIGQNLEALARRFPQDADMLAWTTTARAASLDLNTRARGPITSLQPNASWSVMAPRAGDNSSGSSHRTRWNAVAANAVAALAKRGQKMEPRNGFWWWMETTALLGARRDEQVWAVLRAGGQKSLYDNHVKALSVALHRARLRSQGDAPVTVALRNLLDGWFYPGTFSQTTLQTCENIMAARLMERHKVALEGGRDLVRMGRLLRRAPDDLITPYTGVWIEQQALRYAQVPSALVMKPLKPGASVAVLAGSPGSLLRYANEQKRFDIARELTVEWNAVAAARRAQMAKIKAATRLSLAQNVGLDDTTIALSAGLQNTGSLLVSTLPVPLLLLALGWLPTLWRRPSPVEGAQELPSWTCGLGWSAFSIVVLLGANFVLSNFVWRFVDSRSTIKTPLSFNAMLPRLVGVLPSWAFGFCTLVASAGALWATNGWMRRQNGELPMLARLKNSLHSPDERLQTFDARPLLQLIAVVSAFCFASAALAAWFYLPQDGALQSRSQTTHDWGGGLFLGVFWLVAVLLPVFFRPQTQRLRPFLSLWWRVWRHFLAAHIALATLLYLACNIGGAVFTTRFEAQWNRVFAGTPSSAK
jgi:hypothetical protein